MSDPAKSERAAAVEDYLTEIREEGEERAREILLDLVETIADERAATEGARLAARAVPRQIAESLRRAATILSANPGTAVKVRATLDCADLIERTQG